MSDPATTKGHESTTETPLGLAQEQSAHDASGETPKARRMAYFTSMRTTIGLGVAAIIVATGAVATTPLWLNQETLKSGTEVDSPAVVSGIMETLNADYREHLVSISRDETTNTVHIVANSEEGAEVLRRAAHERLGDITGELGAVDHDVVVSVVDVDAVLAERTP